MATCPHCGKMLPRRSTATDLKRDGLSLQELRYLSRQSHPVWQGVAARDPAKWNGDFAVSVQLREIIRSGDGFVIGPAGRAALAEHDKKEA